MESEEKPFKPTAKKLRKRKEKGEIALSVELTSAILFVGGLLFIWGLHDLFNRGFQQVLFRIFSQLGSLSIVSSLRLAFSPIVFPMLLLFLGVILLTVGAYLFQTGWIWAKRRGKGKKRGRLFFPIAKGTIIAVVGYFVLQSMKPTRGFIFSSPLQKEKYFFSQGFLLALKVGILLLALGLIDFFYQKWRFQKQMRMSYQEIKDERREDETAKPRKNYQRKQRD